MSTVLIYSFAGIALVCIGLLGLLASSHVLRKILAVNVMGSGVFMMLIALAARAQPPDPVPHAMVLTGIVVAVSASALALALLRRMRREEGSALLPEDRRE